MDDHQVAVSSNGKKIYINLMQAPTSDAISRNPNMLSLIKEIMSQCTLKGPGMSLQSDMKRTIGYLDTVITKDDDAIFYARQAKSPVYTRFVKNRKTDPTSIVSIRLRQVAPDSYSVQNVWVGKMPIPFPGAHNETAESYDYWTDHAVVYNGQPLMASSVTKDSPYVRRDAAAAASQAAAPAAA